MEHMETCSQKQDVYLLVDDTLVERKESLTSALKQESFPC